MCLTLDYRETQITHFLHPGMLYILTPVENNVFKKPDQLSYLYTFTA